MGKRKTHAEFLEQIKDRPFSILDTYIGVWERTRFRCHVDGTEFSITPNYVLNGGGCPVCGERRTRDAVRKPNKIIEDHGHWLLVDISLRQFPDATMKIDRVDFDKMSAIGRMFMSHHGYCRIQLKGRQASVARMICGVTEKGIDVDHINHDTVDNRQQNLRVCTHGENLMNSRPQKNNKSGHPGVTRCSFTGRIKVEISHKGKNIFIGRYDTNKDAIAARADAVKKYRGEFAYNPAQDATL